jgi:hypothetical protein
MRKRPKPSSFDTSERQRLKQDEGFVLVQGRAQTPYAASSIFNVSRSWRLRNLPLALRGIDSVRNQK